MYDIFRRINCCVQKNLLACVVSPALSASEIPGSTGQYRPAYSFFDTAVQKNLVIYISKIAVSYE